MLSPYLLAILGLAAFAFVAYQRRQPVAPAARPSGSVIDLDAIEALAKRKAAEVISGKLIDNAAASHIAAHSAVAPPQAPAPPKE